MAKAHPGDEKRTDAVERPKPNAKKRGAKVPKRQARGGLVTGTRGRTKPATDKLTKLSGVSAYETDLAS